ncbi:zinc metalloprotease HtpX [Candidatus Campbellbacteria bacterium CG10_big_fil_rev_8_21_14_0_10_35_52]|uniref:Protease HtpX homolog n=1 Tax=Candidatus Campbellbacteria bacterium CG10_big_fil_rev_8_21_14_0_10_35_52 TaxID=1974527 RepID=A0A2M6WVG8_9BACT|nr:MAG: zinc metalloprotease HtpX [Candidatus Campbellbacteria bacterium CG10_big_fil_rev_8_21_14_0_10_35_52]
MATLYTQQDKNIRKTWFLMMLFLIVIIGIGWAFSFIYQSPAILYFAVLFSVGMNIFSYWYSDKIVLKMSGAKPVIKENNRELWNIVENLSITAGLPMPKLYVIDDLAPNAFATGRNKEHSVIAVTKGLLQTLNKNEIEGVIAHEFSHIGNKDILISTIIVVLVGFVTLLSDFFLRMSIYGRGGGRGGDDRAKIFMTLIGIALAILAPLIAILIQLAISRKREFLADASGALLTRYPEGLASALEKIGKYNTPMKKANKATAHLFISSPFGARAARSGIKKLFMTHPPVEERVKALRYK